MKELFDNSAHKRYPVHVYEFLVIAPFKRSFSSILQTTCHHKFLHPLHRFLPKFDWDTRPRISLVPQHYNSKHWFKCSYAFNLSQFDLNINFLLLASQKKHQRRLGFSLSYSFLFCKNHDYYRIIVVWIRWKIQILYSRPMYESRATFSISIAWVIHGQIWSVMSENLSPMDLEPSTDLLLASQLCVWLRPSKGGWRSTLTREIKSGEQKLTSPDTEKQASRKCCSSDNTETTHICNFCDRDCHLHQAALFQQDRQFVSSCFFYFF